MFKHFCFEGTFPNIFHEHYQVISLSRMTLIKQIKISHIYISILLTILNFAFEILRPVICFSVILLSAQMHLPKISRIIVAGIRGLSLALVPARSCLKVPLEQGFVAFRLEKVEKLSFQQWSGKTVGDFPLCPSRFRAKGNSISNPEKNLNLCWGIHKSLVLFLQLNRSSHYFFYEDSRTVTITKQMSAYYKKYAFKDTKSAFDSALW